MTAFDLADVDYEKALAEWPDYSAPVVNITTELHVNDNGTVTITYRDVPVLDVDALLEQQGTTENRTEMHVALGDAIARKMEQLFGAYFDLDIADAADQSIPFEVVDLG